MAITTTPRQDYLSKIGPEQSSRSIVRGPDSRAGSALEQFGSEMFQKFSAAHKQQAAVDGATAGAMQKFRRNAQGQLKPPVIYSGFLSATAFKGHEKAAILTNAMNAFDGELRINLKQLSQEIGNDDTVPWAEKSALYAEKATDAIDFTLANAPDETQPPLISTAHQLKAGHELALSDQAYEIAKYQTLGSVSSELAAKSKDLIILATAVEPGVDFEQQRSQIEAEALKIAAGFEGLTTEFPKDFNAAAAQEMTEDLYKQVDMALAFAEVMYAYEGGGREAVNEVINKHKKQGAPLPIQNYLQALRGRLDQEANKLLRDAITTDLRNQGMVTLAANVKFNRIRLESNGDINDKMWAPAFEEWSSQSLNINPETGVAELNQGVFVGLLNSFVAMKIGDINQVRTLQENVTAMVTQETLERALREGNIEFTADEALASKNREDNLEYIFDRSVGGFDITTSAGISAAKRFLSHQASVLGSTATRLEKALANIPQYADGSMVPGADAPEDLNLVLSSPVKDQDGIEISPIEGGTPGVHPILTAAKDPTDPASVGEAMQVRLRTLNWEFLHGVNSTETRKALKQYAAGKKPEELMLLLSAYHWASSEIAQHRPALMESFDAKLIGDIGRSQRALNHGFGGYDRDTILNAMLNPESYKIQKAEFEKRLEAEEAKKTAIDEMGKEEFRRRAADHMDMSGLAGFESTLEDRRRHEAAIDKIIEGNQGLWGRWWGIGKSYIYGANLWDSKYRDKRPTGEWNIEGYRIAGPLSWARGVLNRGWNLTNIPGNFFMGPRRFSDGSSQGAKDFIENSILLHYASDPLAPPEMIMEQVAKDAGRSLSLSLGSGGIDPERHTTFPIYVLNEDAVEYGWEKRNPYAEPGEVITAMFHAYDQLKTAIADYPDKFDFGLDDIETNTLKAFQAGRFYFRRIPNAAGQGEESRFEMVLRMKGDTTTPFDTWTSYGDIEKTWRGEGVLKDGVKGAGIYDPDGNGDVDGLILGQGYHQNNVWISGQNERNARRTLTDEILEQTWLNNYKSLDYERNASALAMEVTTSPALKAYIGTLLYAEDVHLLEKGWTEENFPNFHLLKGKTNAEDGPVFAMNEEELNKVLGEDPSKFAIPHELHSAMSGKNPENLSVADLQRRNSGEYQQAKLIVELTANSAPPTDIVALETPDSTLQAPFIPSYLESNVDWGLPDPVPELAIEAIQDKKFYNKDIYIKTLAPAIDRMTLKLRDIDLGLPTIAEQESYDIPDPVAIDKLTLKNWAVSPELAAALTLPTLEHMALLMEAAGDPNAQIVLPTILSKEIKSTVEILNLDFIPVKKDFVELVPVDPANPPDSMKEFIRPLAVTELGRKKLRGGSLAAATPLEAAPESIPRLPPSPPSVSELPTDKEKESEVAAPPPVLPTDTLTVEDKDIRRRDVSVKNAESIVKSQHLRTEEGGSYYDPKTRQLAKDWIRLVEAWNARGGTTYKWDKRVRTEAEIEYQDAANQMMNHVKHQRKPKAKIFKLIALLRTFDIATKQDAKLVLPAGEVLE